MDIKSMVNRVIAREKSLLGAEPVEFSGGEIVQMLLPRSRESNEVYGGEREGRSISATCEAGVIPSYVDTGEIVTARGEEWKVETLERGLSLDTIRLIDPYRYD